MDIKLGGVDLITQVNIIHKQYENNTWRSEATTICLNRSFA